MKKNRKDTQRTGFASELYVLSLLQRVGANAFMSFGNTKKVDIIVQKGSEALTIDVKGGSNSFPLNKKYKENLKDKNHYYIFVDYKGKFEDITVIPDIYIVPSVEMNFVREYDTKASNHRFNVLKNDIKEKFTNDLSIFVEEKTNGLVQ